MNASKWTGRGIVSGLAVTAAMLVPYTAAAQEARPALFTAAARGPAARVAGAVRARRLAVRADLLSAALAPGAASDAPFVLNLFPDVTLTLVRERLERGPQGLVTWAGHVRDDRDSIATLTWDGRVLSGGVVTHGAAYDVSTGADGAVVISQRPAGEMPVELAPRAPAQFARERAPLVATAGDAGTAAIDLLVLYTPAARVRAGGDAQMQAQLANAVAVTNTAFQRSGVNAVMTAVGIRELPYVEGAGLGADLNAISMGGAMSASVEALRQTLGADLVALVTGRASTSGGCGLAWLGPSASAAYSASEQACLYAGQWSFSHELGHNLGADHAPGDSSPIGVAYAHGYRDSTVRTLMAYAVYGSPARVLNYSNPNVSESGVPTGTSLQDNARRLNETVATVAAYMPGTSGPTAPQAPTGLAVNVTGLSIAMSWNAAATATSYIVQIGRTPGDASFYATTVTAPSLSGPIPAGTYYWRVIAQNASGNSAASAEGTFTVAPTAPSAPAVPLGFTASASGSSVTVSWTPGAGSTATSYSLEAGPSEGSAAYGALSLTTTSVTVPNVPNGTYYLRVRAVSPGGVSAPSAEAVVTVGQSCQAPGASTLTGSVNGGAVSLNWNAVSGTGPFTYTLAVGSTPGGSQYGVYPMGGAQSVSATPAPGTYYVRVTAANACGTGSTSADVTLVVP